ncbi:hypothetical protein HAX54_046912 [Datura stramonium]|uniref:Uncharacterized protein n=1 Tax=Datura stramonium TaxID=4076 RepID=A0ABS8SSK8_DATST|nr:hypothetical protein [Datura stramonium]
MREANSSNHTVTMTRRISQKPLGKKFTDVFSEWTQLKLIFPFAKAGIAGEETDKNTNYSTYKTNQMEGSQQLEILLLDGTVYSAIENDLNWNLDELDQVSFKWTLQKYSIAAYRLLKDVLHAITKEEGAEQGRRYDQTKNKFSARKKTSNSIGYKLPDYTVNKSVVIST